MKSQEQEMADWFTERYGKKFNLPEMNERIGDLVEYLLDETEKVAKTTEERICVFNALIMTVCLSLEDCTMEFPGGADGAKSFLRGVYLKETGRAQ